MKTRLFAFATALAIALIVTRDTAMAQLNNAFNEIPLSQVAVTTDTTPQVIFKVPLGELHVAYIDLFVLVLADDFNDGGAVTAQSVAARRPGGNVVALPAKISTLINTFTPTAPQLSIVGNTTTQTIDVTVTGIAGRSLRWWMDGTAHVSI